MRAIQQGRLHRADPYLFEKPTLSSWLRHDTCVQYSRGRIRKA